jgi:integrase/recombinase XerD
LGEEDTKVRILPKTISEKEFIEGLKLVKKPYLKVAFMLGFYECLRVSEVVKLRSQDIDKDRGFIHVLAGKGNKDRDVPIMKPLASSLRFLPIPVGIRALQKSVNKYWPGLHFHSLRHSGATYYLNVRKVGLRQIQQLLGHSRLDTTQIYTHVTPEGLKESFDEAWNIPLNTN